MFVLAGSWRPRRIQMSKASSDGPAPNRLIPKTDDYRVTWREETVSEMKGWQGGGVIGPEPRMEVRD